MSDEQFKDIVGNGHLFEEEMHLKNISILWKLATYEENCDYGMIADFFESATLPLEEVTTQASNSLEAFKAMVEKIMTYRQDKVNNEHRNTLA